jgi:hypothetical protein
MADSLQIETQTHQVRVRSGATVVDRLQIEPAEIAHDDTKFACAGGKVSVTMQRRPC